MVINRRVTRFFRRVSTVGLVSGLMLFTAGTGMANASTGPLGGSAYLAQSRAAGLSLPEAAALQARVDGYLAKSGGTQVAANEIRLPGDATLLLALPGEQRPRSLTAPKSQAVPWPIICIEFGFCAFSLPDYGGDEVMAYYCNRLIAMPWAGNGSYINIQTPGTRALFLDAHKLGYALSAPAVSESSNYYWTPIWYINPC